MGKLKNKHYVHSIPEYMRPLQQEKN